MMPCEPCDCSSLEDIYCRVTFTNHHITNQCSKSCTNNTNNTWCLPSTYAYDHSGSIFTQENQMKQISLALFALNSLFYIF